jgi:hypothetical protein
MITFSEGNDERNNMKKLSLIVGLAGVLCAVSVQAALVTEVNVGPAVNVTVTSTLGGFNGGGAAGVYNLIVDGVATPSFCIDVFRIFSPSGTPYSYSSLDLAPLAPAGPMGAAAATDIRKLWAAYFAGTAGNNNEAAALQSAIWLDIRIQSGIGALTVNGNSLSDPVYFRANQMLASLGSLSAEADLRALVNDNGYQNYVVPVPEPATMIAGALLLLPFGASTIRFMRKSRIA